MTKNSFVKSLLTALTIITPVLSIGVDIINRNQEVEDIANQVVKKIDERSKERDGKESISETKER